MNVFVTGGTGYLGSYVLAEYFRDPRVERLWLLTRATNRAEGHAKLWRALQLHLSAEEFYQGLHKVEIVSGDLTAPQLGMSDAMLERVVQDVDSVLHIAASLNRKSAKACFNANLRGTLSMLQLARRIADKGQGLKRFSFVSTTAVCGKRNACVVHEDEAVDWALSDYDPYGRTKKFCEHMVEQLLPDVSTVIFRPSTVLGDSRFPQTTQFDMARAFCFFADLPAVPIAPDTRQDIVNADFVGKAIATLHLKTKPRHRIYHLSGGQASRSAEVISQSMNASVGRRTPRFMRLLERPFAGVVDRLASGPKGQLSLMASLLKVFLPYVTNDVVYDNARVVDELGFAPVPFTDYCGAFYRWTKEHNFKYPYAPLPAEPVTFSVAVPLEAE